MGRAHLARLVTFATLAGWGLAQAPANATQLNTIYNPVDLRFLHTGDVVHAFGASNSTTHYGRSADGGRTWSPTDQLLANMRSIAFAASGDLLVVCGIPTLLAAGSPLVVTSHDLGLTWSTPMAIEPSFMVNLSNKNGVVAHADGTDVLVVYTDIQAGRLLARRSTDGGLTFPGPTMVLDQATFSHPSSGGPQLVEHGGALVASWFTYNNTPLPRLQVSTDGGLTWLPTARPVPGWYLYSASSALLTHPFGGILQRSTDLGVTWTPVPGLLIDSVRDVATSGDDVVVVGMQQISGASNWVIHTSHDGGATWVTPPWVAPSVAEFRPDAQIVGNDLYVCFARNDAQPELGVLAHSDDGGQTWSALQYGISRLGAGPRRNVHVMLNAPSYSGNFAFVGVGTTVLAGGSAGTGGAVPELSLSALPLLGHTVDLTIADAVPGSFGLIGLTWNAPLATPLFGGTLWLQGDRLSLLFLTGGGSANTPLSVPNAPSLRGAALTGQAVVLDAAAVGGLALSNGVEIWLR